METYIGHVRTPADAIILFEACRLGLLPRVQRRLSDKERQLITSGSVFVWDEREAGMRRWTDGKSWSASRVSGSFLTYREMEGKRGGGNAFAPPVTTMNLVGRTPGSSDGNSDSDGADGSEGYRYKPDGLMKQSFSITTAQGQKLHLISYFARSHPLSGSLVQPSNDPQLLHIRPVSGMYPDSVGEHQNGPAVTTAPMTTVPMGSSHPAVSFPSRPSLNGGQLAYSAFSPGPWSPHYAQAQQQQLQQQQQQQQSQQQHYHVAPLPPPVVTSMTYHPASFPVSTAPPNSFDHRPSLPQLEGLTTTQSPGYRGSISSNSPLIPSPRSQHQNSPRAFQARPHESTPPLNLPPPDLSNSPHSSRGSRPPSPNSINEITPLRENASDTRSENGDLVVQDIPGERLTFGEDSRQLSLLDKAAFARRPANLMQAFSS